MGRSVSGFRAAQQQVQTGEVGAQIAVGGDDRARPRHHLVAAKQRVFFGQREADVVGAMSRRVHRAQVPIQSGDDAAVAKLVVGSEVVVDAACR